MIRVDLHEKIKDLSSKTLRRYRFHRQLPGQLLRPRQLPCENRDLATKLGVFVGVVKQIIENLR